MDSVNYGLVGIGNTPNSAWPYHYAGTKDNPKINFTSVFDIDLNKGKKLAKLFKLKFYDSFDAMLESDIDAVLVLVPHHAHEEVVVEAAKAGKHILCEKPMATTLEGCDHMIEATKKAGVKFMIAENHRFLPAHQSISDFVKEGFIGNPFMVRTFEGVYETHNINNPKSWKANIEKAGGGALMDMGVHKFATLNWILNDTVDSAYCWLTKQVTDLPEKAEDNAFIFLKYHSGIIIECTLSFTVNSPPSNHLEIYGTKGSLIENHSWKNPIRLYSSKKLDAEKYDGWYLPKINHGPFPKYYLISMGIEDAHFTECVLTDKDPVFKPEDAREAVATALLAYLSAIEGKTTRMDELIDLYKKKGTKSIFEQLPKAIQINTILDK
ncbi:MAG: Gfo/Idh/MocA family oxidoreductase [Promethearchaeota archaeon]|nr:MAG: Gfo/Idh/MocA family oxidoreductase [Candidatus Lokiarchaeota archaeon]